MESLLAAASTGLFIGATNLHAATTCLIVLCNCASSTLVLLLQALQARSAGTGLVSIGLPMLESSIAFLRGILLKYI